ncbi:MAG TPA: hypothetical protein VG275_08255 [Solirubrobacteraceae bacterium]|jgi:hypothetical protein|nr:hypothetical protein [Solirubrobacteraceae bacterium]
MATAATILCLIALASCGGNTTAQFKTGYAAARVPLNRTLTAIGTAVTRTPGKTAAGIIRRLGVLSVGFGNELGPLLALKPPAGVATAFRTLTRSMQRVKRDLQGTYLALRGQNLPAAQLALESVRSDAAAAADAGAAITEKLAHQ